MPVKTLSTYKNWNPLEHSVIKDEGLRRTLHEKGYAVVPFLSAAQLAEIKALYATEHSLDVKSGGMFYSLYSKDLAYRKRVHGKLGDVFAPLLGEHFIGYKNIINIFITKTPGPESEFYVHQDTTATDEFRHSPLSIWVALQDITSENGALGVIEKTHWFFSPYRGISFAQPFGKINATLRRYLKPVYLKAGEAIIFDPRIVHHSMPNVSGADRLVALCGVFPEQADFLTCFKDKAPGSKIEIFRHEDSYILENTGFYYNCHERPSSGTLVKEVEHDFPEMRAQTFEELCQMNGIEPCDALSDGSEIKCRMIAEPDGINLDATCETAPPVRSGWQKLKALFN